MPGATTQAFDPTNGTTPVTLPTQDACCQVPCDPPWLKSACITFTEIKTSVILIEGGKGVGDFARGFVTVNVTYTHTLCLVGKQHGGLAYTLTLLPGEKMTLYHSDRYRRTTRTQSAIPFKRPSRSLCPRSTSCRPATIRVFSPRC